MKIKKIILGAMIGTSLVLGGCYAEMPEEQIPVGIKSEETYNLESLTEKFYDDKGFKIESKVTVFKGYDKYNGYNIMYKYDTNPAGELAEEYLEITNEDFKGEKAPPLFSMFGEIPPAPKEDYSVQRNADGNYKIVDDENEYEITENGGKVSSSGKIKPWEQKKKLKEYKEKFEMFKKLIKTTETQKKSVGANRSDYIKKFNMNLIDEEGEPDYYTTNVSYSWYSGYGSKKIDVTYYIKKDTKLLTLRSDNYLENLQITYSPDGNVKKIDVEKGFNNVTTIEKDIYIRSLYTQEQIDEIFQMADEFYKKIEESIKDLPEKGPEDYYGWP